MAATDISASIVKGADLYGDNYNRKYFALCGRFDYPQHGDRQEKRKVHPMRRRL